MSSIVIPLRSSSFRVAGMGPVSMITGSTPTVVWSTIRARGLSPRDSAFSRSISSTAAAPSEICEELPAVTLPSSLKAGLSCDSVSRSRVGPDALVGHVGVAVHLEGHDLALEAALLGGLVGQLVGAHADLVELRARGSPTCRRSSRPRCPAARGCSARSSSGGQGEPTLVDPLEARRPTGCGPCARRPSRWRRRARRRRSGRRRSSRPAGPSRTGGRPWWRASRSGGPAWSQALRPMLNICSPNCCTQPVITSSTSEASMPGALDDLGVGLAEELVRVGVLVVALLRVAAPDRGANRLDDDYLTPVPVLHAGFFLQGRFVASVSDCQARVLD